MLRRNLSPPGRLTSDLSNNVLVSISPNELVAPSHFSRPQHLWKPTHDGTDPKVRKFNKVVSDDLNRILRGQSVYCRYNSTLAWSRELSGTGDASFLFVVLLHAEKSPGWDAAMGLMIDYLKADQETSDWGIVLAEEKA